MHRAAALPTRLTVALLALALLPAAAQARGPAYAGNHELPLEPRGWPSDGPWRTLCEWDYWSGEGQLRLQERYGQRWVTRAVAERSGTGESQLVWDAGGRAGQPHDRRLEQVPSHRKDVRPPLRPPEYDTLGPRAWVCYVPPSPGPRAGSEVLASGVASEPIDLPPVSDYLNAAGLPTAGILWRGQPMIVIDAPGLADRPREAAALLDCPRWSGCLVLSRPAWRDLPADSELGRCLPRDGSGRLRPDAFSLPERPALAARREGHGWIVQLDGPVPLDAAYWQRIALNFGARATPEPSRGADFLPPERLARFLDPVRAMPLAPLAWYLLAYLLLTMVMLAASRARPQLRWLGTPLLAAAFLPAARGIHEHFARPTTDLSVVTQATTCSGQRAVDLLSALHLGSAVTRDYALGLGGAYPWPRYESGRAVTTLTSDRLPLGVTGWHLRGGTDDVLRTAAVGDLGGTVELSLRQAGAVVTGRVTNHLPCALRNAVLVVGDGFVTLGTLAAGATRTVPTGDVRWPTAWPNSLACELTRGGQGNERWLAPLARQPQDGVEGIGSDRAELLAWIDSSWSPVTIGPTPDSQRTLTLLRVLGRLAVPDALAVDGSLGDAHRLAKPDARRNQRWCWATFDTRGRQVDALTCPRTGGGPVRLWNRRQQHWQQVAANQQLTPAADYLTGCSVAMRYVVGDGDGPGVTALLSATQTDGTDDALG